MGWTIELRADRPIDTADVNEAVKQLPPSLHGFMGISTQQAWGWSTAVDIHNPDGPELRLGGSFTQSGQIAEAAAQTIARLLEMRGYVIEVGDLS